MKIAVVGCSHGELDKIFADLKAIEERDKIKIELLIICGDFQAVRNFNDLQCMAVPQKFRQLGTFHKYYTGELLAPYLTIFVGGNHEASNYLMTLPYGGWVAPRIYFLGYANVLRVGGLRIGGMSGIWGKNRKEASSGHFERLPFDNSTIRSVYHIREFDVYRIMQLKRQSQENRKQPIDVFVTHDWPVNIHECGNVNYLLRKKPFFREDISKGALGNPLFSPIVQFLRPRCWFAAHLHVKFEAHVQHEDGQTTSFQALDKCLNRRPYFAIHDINPVEEKSEEASSDLVLEYDPEWLAILKATNDKISTERQSKHVVYSWAIQDVDVNETQLECVDKLMNSDYKIPENFTMSEPVTSATDDSDPSRVKNFTNPQTTEFCKKLGITDPMAVIVEASMPKPNPDQISISDDEEEEESESSTANASKKLKCDEDESGGLFFIDKTGESSKEFDKSVNANTLVKIENQSFSSKTDSKEIELTDNLLNTTNKSVSSGSETLNSSRDKESCTKLSDAKSKSIWPSPERRTELYNLRVEQLTKLQFGNECAAVDRPSTPKLTKRQKQRMKFKKRKDEAIKVNSSTNKIEIESFKERAVEAKERLQWLSKNMLEVEDGKEIRVLTTEELNTE